MKHQKAQKMQYKTEKRANHENAVKQLDEHARTMAGTQPCFGQQSR